MKLILAWATNLGLTNPSSKLKKTYTSKSSLQKGRMEMLMKVMGRLCGIFAQREMLAGRRNYIAARMKGGNLYQGWAKIRTFIAYRTKAALQ